LTKPRFSIVTCTWNSEPWLDASIASVLQQEGPTVEYIFVDGGSTDGTMERIQTIRPAVKLIRNIRGGVSRAMNCGLAAASGDIIAHLHSDDFYLHSQVLKMVDSAFTHNACKWLFGRTMIASDGKLLPENWTAPRFSYSQLLKGNFIPHPATFVERKLMQQAGGFDTSLRYAMDYDLWLKLAKLANPLQLNTPLAAFREHAGSLSTRNKLAAMREDFAVRMRHTQGTPFLQAMHFVRYCVRHQKARYLIQRGSNA
jgi:glycosyltransferase involved in cell wall biosynthesis